MIDEAATDRLVILSPIILHLLHKILSREGALPFFAYTGMCR